MKPLALQNKKDIDGLLGSCNDNQRSTEALEQTLIDLEEKVSREADFQDQLSDNIDWLIERCEESQRTIARLNEKTAEQDAKITEQADTIARQARTLSELSHRIDTLGQYVRRSQMGAEGGSEAAPAPLVAVYMPSAPYGVAVSSSPQDLQPVRATRPQPAR